MQKIEHTNDGIFFFVHSKLNYTANFLNATY